MSEHINQLWDSLTPDERKCVAAYRVYGTTEAADDMRLILRALDIQVRASRDKVEIEGALPVPESAGDQDLVTIVQTSGCVFNSDQKYHGVPIKTYATLS